MKRFWTLSRIPHAILDLATPAFCALLWQSGWPAPAVAVIASITGFAAYMGVYALNDLMGCRLDREKMAHAKPDAGYAIESGDRRHPLAQGHLTLKMGAAWAGTWLTLAGLGAGLLNPVILLVLFVAVACEMLYCRLFTVTHGRFILSGIVKAAGPMAAILVVDPAPALPLLALVFTWVFMWELGGQNIPADWHDQQEDARVGGKTIPLILGTDAARRIILICASLSTVLGGLMVATIAPELPQMPTIAAIILAGLLLFLRPAWQLYRARNISGEPGRLFHLASFYPAALMAIIIAAIGAT